MLYLHVRKIIIIIIIKIIIMCNAQLSNCVTIIKWAIKKKKENLITYKIG